MASCLAEDTTDELDGVPRTQRSPITERRPSSGSSSAPASHASNSGPRTLVDSFEPSISPISIDLRYSSAPPSPSRRAQRAHEDDDAAPAPSASDGRGYEDQLVSGAHEGDLDVDAIGRYLDKLLDLYPSTELRDATPAEIAQSVGGARRAGGKVVPTVAGLLLFGRRSSLARFFPELRIDYFVASESGGAPQEARLGLREVHEPLPSAFRRVYQAVADDLSRCPGARPFGAPHLRAVPKCVLREAIVNAILHRDYRVSAPVEVVRFTDRIEVRSPGVALVPDEELGSPGSFRRNPRIAEVFRDVGLAETKGTGIRAMRRAMSRAELAPPGLGSDLRAERFVTTIAL